MSQFLGGPSQSVVGHTVRNFKVPQQSVPRSLGRKEPHSEVDNNMKYVLCKKKILVLSLHLHRFREFRARLVQLDHASSKRICTRESSNEIHNATSCLKCLTTTFSCPYDGFDFHTRLTHPATWLFAVGPRISPCEKIKVPQHEEEKNCTGLLYGIWNYFHSFLIRKVISAA
mgnify:CR=1 FL=1